MICRAYGTRAVDGTVTHHCRGGLTYGGPTGLAEIAKHPGKGGPPCKEVTYMADTRMQLEVEDWVRRNWMPTHFGAGFSRERLRLRSGGVFDFDAVSEDRSIVATISTSGAKTAGGKNAVGKILKLPSDMLFLTMVEAKRRVIVLTERDMCDQCERELAGGRVPKEIEFVCAAIPDEVRTRLIAARSKASGESSGGGGADGSVP